MGPSNILTVWDGETLKVRRRISSYPVTNVISSVPSPDGSLLLMATAEGGLWLMGLAQGAESVPSCLQPSGPRFSVGISRGNLRLWRAPSWTEIDAAEKAQASAGSPSVR